MELHTEEALSSSRNTINTQPELILDYVRKWGGAASDAVLDPQCQAFTVPNIEGMIGYRVEFSSAIVFGDPVCPPQQIKDLTLAFHTYCQQQKWSIIYITTSEEFAKWAINNICKTSVEFGEELIIDPHADPRAREGVQASLVRRKVKHALREGASVKEYLSNDPLLEDQIEQVGQTWLKARQGPQVHISHVRLFDNRLGKRWFYAEQNERLVGVLLLNQLQAHQGWLLNHLMHTPDAPHGTPELLVVSALEKLAEEGCHYVTFGSVPGEKLGHIVGVGSSTNWFMRVIFQIAKTVFGLQGRKKFWEKFHPESKKSYLLFSQSGLSIREIISLIKSLNMKL